MLRYLLFLCSVFSLLSCSRSTSDKVTHEVDMDEMVTQITRICVQNPQKALLIIDSVRAASHIEPHQADFLRAIVYTQDDAKIDSARILLEGLIEHDSVKKSVHQRANVMGMLITLNRIKKNDEQVLYWATQLLEQMREMGSEDEIQSIQVEIGLALTQLGHPEEGLKKIDDAINNLDKIRKFTQLEACLHAMKRKIRVMNKLEDYQASIAIAERIILKVTDFKEHPQEYKDNSGHLPDTPEEIEAYCNNHTAQAYAFLAYAYASTGNQSNSLAGIKNIQLARKYAGLFENMKYGQTCSGRKLISSTWFKLGEYGKMETTYRDIMDKWGNDTLQVSYATMLYHMAQASYYQSRYQDSFDYWKRYADITEKLNTHSMQAIAQDYAARYHEQEQKHIIHKAEAELARKNIILFVTFIFVIIAIISSFYFYHIRKRIDDKNRALVKVINELQDVKDIKDVKDHPDQTKTDEEKESTKMESRPSRLFSQIDEYIRSERLYTDPNLQRQDVLDHFSINKNTLNALFNEHNGGLSFPAYINNLRLEEGQHLLRSNSAMTITDIANAIGFSAPNFREQFKKKFGITPTEFRQNL